MYFETNNEKLDTSKILIGIGITLMLIGTAIATVVPYEIYTSYTYYNPLTYRYETMEGYVTVYGHPAGWAVDMVGFCAFLGGLWLYKRENS